MRHLVLAVLVALLSAIPATGAGGSFAYITGTGSFDLNVIDTYANELSAPIAVGAVTRGVAVDPNGGRVYVATANGIGRLFAIDTQNPANSTHRDVGASPFGVAAVATPTGTRVFVAHRGPMGRSGFVSVIDVSSTGAMTEKGFAIVGGAPTGVAATKDGTRVYVANSSGRISAVDITAQGDASLYATAFTGGALVGIAVSPDGSRVYAANHGGNNLFVLNTSTLMDPTPSISSIVVGSNPYGVAVSQDGHRVYVANYGSNSLSVILDGVAAEPIGVGRQPLGVAVSSDGSRVYVVNSSLLVAQEDPSVTVLTGTGGFIKKIDLPHNSFPVGLGMFLAGSPLINVEIDIRPASINTKAQGTIPVILFGSATFHVDTVDLTTVKLGGASVAVRGNGPMAQYGDWGKGDEPPDGIVDVMLHFESDEIQAGTVRSMSSSNSGLALEGRTFDGMSFEGTDAVRVK